MKIKNILKILALCIVAVSCTDDIELRNYPEGNDDGMMTINFSMPEPEPEIIRTRATTGTDSEDERKINTLAILIFDKNQNKLLQKEVVMNVSSSTDGITGQVNGKDGVNDDNNFSYKFRKRGSAVSTPESDYEVYVVANAINSDTNLLSDFTDDSDKTPEDLKNVTHTNYQTSGHFLTGKAEKSGGSYSVILQRSSAKITIGKVTAIKDEDFVISLMEDVTDEGQVVGQQNRGYKVYNVNRGAYLTAPLNDDDRTFFFNGDNRRRDDTKVNEVINGTEERPTYRYDCKVSPTRYTEEGSDLHPQFVIGGIYKGVFGYYCIELRNIKDNGEIEYIDIRPNHWYKVEIENVSGPGFATEEEARANPCNDRISVTIRDHSENVLSIVSDGTKELGVTRELKTSSTSASLTLRFYDKDGNYPSDAAAVKSMIRITEGSNWISIGTPVEITDHSEEVVEAGGDVETPGRRWRVPVNFDISKSIGGMLEGNLEIKWGVLTREVPVIYDSQFSPENLLGETTLRMYEGNNLRYEIWDDEKHSYWTFLSGMENGGVLNNLSGATTRLYGAQPEDMAEGKIRNEGFHFPVMYGEDTKWHYEYQMNFYPLGGNDDWRTYKAVSFDVVADKVADQSFWNDYIKIKGGAKNTSTATGLQFNVTYTRESSNFDSYLTYFFIYNDASKDKYLYSTARFVMTLTRNDDTTEIYEIPLYHTGFFHEDNSGDAEGGKTGFFYYEVVPLGNQFWLDRNLGATASGLYIEAADGSSYLGTTDNREFDFLQGSKGGFYKIADKSGDMYVINPKILNNVCPPGYHVPTQPEFDQVRTSKNFNNQYTFDGGTGHYTSYYESSVGKVYFPKSRFQNKINSDYIKVGNANSGYYWTQTTSEGLEKDQIGSWLKVLYMSGTSNSYINGDVENQRMSVRCIAGKEPEQAQRHTISFNVKGVTHVYLYTGSDENKSGLFNFPGKPIANQATADKLTSVNFSYISSYDVSQLKVFFAYVTDEGKITIMDNGGDGTLSGAKGWSVVKGGNYFFTADHQKDNEGWSGIN